MATSVCLSSSSRSACLSASLPCLACGHCQSGGTCVLCSHCLVHGARCLVKSAEGQIGCSISLPSQTPISLLATPQTPRPPFSRSFHPSPLYPSSWDPRGSISDPLTLCTPLLPMHWTSHLANNAIRCPRLHAPTSARLCRNSLPPSLASALPCLCPPLPFTLSIPPFYLPICPPVRPSVYPSLPLS